MTSKRNKLQEDTHFRVLRLLQDNPEMSQRELAAAAGISVGGTHYVNCPGFVRGLFLQNSGGFFKGVQLCIEFILHFLRRPMANGAM